MVIKIQNGRQNIYILINNEIVKNTKEKLMKIFTVMY